MTDAPRPTFPVWTFDPRRSRLFFNVFGRRSPTPRQQREIASVAAYLEGEARAGRIDTALAVGWGGNSGLLPENPADVTNDEIMREWRERALKIAVRVRADEPILADEKAHAHERR